VTSGDHRHDGTSQLSLCQPRFGYGRVGYTDDGLDVGLWPLSSHPLDVRCVVRVEGGPELRMDDNLSYRTTLPCDRW